jgi:uncharacterized LabA/DUF88 family protein
MLAQVRHHPQAAVFVDAENHADLHVFALMQRLDRLNIVERHAYADWRHPRLDRLAERLEHADFEMHHTWSGHRCGCQKNKVDRQMERDILRVVSGNPEIAAVIIVSGDAYFAGVVRQLSQRGKQVIVAADPLRASKELRRMADGYLSIGTLGRWVRKLDQLERTSKFLTFRFVVQKLEVGSSDLSKLVQRGLLVQEDVQRPGRGTRREIRLNREAQVVRVTLSSMG